MALPGMRGYGRDDGWQGGRRSGYRAKSALADNISSLSGGGGGGGSNPALERKVDQLDQRLGQQESSNRAILEQIMKIQQEFKVEMKKYGQILAEEKSQRLSMSQSLNGSVRQLKDLDERVRIVENAGRDNKSALTQLITHTKNIERAVTLSQQDAIAKKDQQGSKILELSQKLSSFQEGRNALERSVYAVRDEVKDLDSKIDTIEVELKDFEGAVKLQAVTMEKLSENSRSKHKHSKDSEKMTETQRAVLEAKIMQCQQSILDVATKLSTEKRDRDQDFDQVNSRITELVADLATRERTRESSQREQEAKAREQSQLGNAEKQKIIMQISAVQTDLVRMMDERETKSKEATQKKIEDINEKVLAIEKSVGQFENENKSVIKSEFEKQKTYVDTSSDNMIKMNEAESGKMRARLSQFSDDIQTLEGSMAELRSSVAMQIEKLMQEADSREKILDAKIEDQGDKLRLGMVSLQSAIGEGKPLNGEIDDGDFVALDEVEKIQSEAMDGLRESFAKQLSTIEADISSLNSKFKNNSDLIEARLRSHQKDGEDASNILGDKLHQKMDSMVFTQERLRRHVEELEDQIGGGSSADVSDLRHGIFTCDFRDRIEDIERLLAKSQGSSANESDVTAIRKDLDKILGINASDTALVDGIPTLSKLEKDIDTLDSNYKTLTTGVQDLKDQLTESILQEKQSREEESGALKSDLERLEKRSKELKEKLKGKLGVALPENDASEDEEEKNE